MIAFPQPASEQKSAKDNLLFAMLQMRKNKTSLCKWSGGTAQLRISHFRGHFAYRCTNAIISNVKYAKITGFKQKKQSNAMFLKHAVVYTATSHNIE